MDRINVLEREKGELSDALDSITNAMGSKIEPIDIADLIEGMKNVADLKEEIDRLQSQLADKNAKLTELTDKKNELEEQLQRLQKKVNELEKSLENAETIEARALEEIQKLKEALTRCEEKLKTTERILDTIKKKPGDIPPCWLVEVPSPEGLRAKHLKIYDVKIKDLTLTVRPHPYPYPPNANFGDESQLPVIDEKFFNTELTPDKFLSVFQGVKDAGENRLIQNYSCRFMVDVYDETSAGNKEGYKSQLRVVEDLFYKFEEQSAWDKKE